MSRPIPGTYAPYFERYIALTQGNHLYDLQRNHSQKITQFFRSIPNEKAEYAYAEGKWTVKEVIQHIIDTERIFSYRLLRIARNDTTPLSGFDENNFTVNAHAHHRSLGSLIEEFFAVRKATDLLIDSIQPQALQLVGTASNHPCSANALVFMIYGHILHHINIFKERYGL
ncbi:MAG TPA: DNA damage-inducible protein DinB [Chitinophagaceae bacterium]|nr:DNA damage-inducible protein DinB [Chitinophagaceae bacterium]